jgi:hypothetical protein
MNKGAGLRLCSLSSCYWTVAYLAILIKNYSGSKIGVAQIWMQILFKVAQFWMPFNTITPTDTSAAITLIGVTEANFLLV